MTELIVFAQNNLGFIIFGLFATVLFLAFIALVFSFVVFIHSMVNIDKYRQVYKEMINKLLN